MRAPRRSARVDANQSDLVKLARRLGAYWKPDGVMCDGWLGWRGGWCPVEIKDGTKPPSARTLTDAEARLKRDCQMAQLPHAVVTSEEDLLQLMGLKKSQ